jgi:Mrp family chromosome partitioning ATPase
MHRQLGAPIEAGLTEYLSGEVDEFAIIQYSQNEKFFFIPSGMHVKTPSELISNGRLKNLIDFLRPNFDWIILDSPPCLPVADPTVLAEFCDGVLMIVRAESTPWETAQRACQEFRKEGFLGVVLNSVDPESTNGSYGYTLYNQYSDKSARS